MRKIRLGIRLVIVISIIFVLIIPLSINNGQNAEYVSSITVERINSNAAAWITSSPINITNNEDFALQGWPGSGVEQDPYRIEDISIVTDGNCISVENTSAHFVISRCFLSSITHECDDIFDDSAGSGIYLFNVSDCRIADCTIQYKYYGCCMYWFTSNCILTGNQFSFCFRSGVFSASASYCTFTENTLSHNSIAFELRGGGLTPHSKFFTISNNSIRYNSWGIYMNAVDSCVIDHNIIENCVVGVVGYLYNMTIMHNEIDTVSTSGIVIDPGSWGLIKGNRIANIGGTGLDILAVENLTVSHNSIEHCRTGVYSHGEPAVFEWNNISFNQRGFELQDCHDCIVRNNLISDNDGYGLYLSGSTFNNSIYYNTFINNQFSNAGDYGDGNIWDDGISKGNVWDDYIGIGAYGIRGYSGSTDRYPTNPERGLQYHVIIPPIGLGLIIVVVSILLYQRRNIIRIRLKHIIDWLKARNFAKPINRD